MITTKKDIAINEMKIRIANIQSNIDNIQNVETFLDDSSMMEAITTGQITVTDDPQTVKMFVSKLTG